MEKKVLIIIPAYNEAENIERVTDELTRDFPRYDYLIVNDCSTDSTGEIIRKRGYNYISLPVNLGIGGGVQSGYMYAAEKGYDIAVQMDGDGQHDPAYIEKLIAPIISGEADIAIGSRFIDKKGFQTSFLRRLGNRLISLVIRVCCGVNATDTTSGFRASGREATLFFADNYAQDYPEPEAIVSAALRGFKIKDVAVEMNKRQGGISSINAPRSVYYMIKVSLAIIICRISYGRRKK